jgi:hypothetical protein
MNNIKRSAIVFGAVAVTLLMVSTAVAVPQVNSATATNITKKAEYKKIIYTKMVKSITNKLKALMTSERFLEIKSIIDRSSLRNAFDDLNTREVMKNSIVATLNKLNLKDISKGEIEIFGNMEKTFSQVDINWMIIIENVISWILTLLLINVIADVYSVAPSIYWLGFALGFLIGYELAVKFEAKHPVILAFLFAANWPYYLAAELAGRVIDFIKREGLSNSDGSISLNITFLDAVLENLKRPVTVVL